jgi:hypothetical protein
MQRTPAQSGYYVRALRFGISGSMSCEQDVKRPALTASVSFSQRIKLRSWANGPNRFQLPISLDNERIVC